MTKNTSFIIIFIIVVGVLFYLGMVFTKPVDLNDAGSVSDLNEETAIDSTTQINSSLDNLDIDAGVDADLDSIDEEINNL